MKTKILIVEDSDEVVEIYTTALTNAGYAVDVAKNGVEALSKVLAVQPDLILLDLMLPGLSGLDVLQKIRNDKEYRHIQPKVIVLTNMAGMDFAEKAKQHGVSGYLLKSDVTPSGLVAMINNLESQPKTNQQGFGIHGGLILLILIAAIVGVGWYVVRSNDSSSVNKTDTSNSTASRAEDYNPIIEPSNFVSSVDNKYFKLTPGTKYAYKIKTEEGLETIETVVTEVTKKILGVTTIEVRDKSWLDDELTEDTKDWYAQDKDGNVWYFGEAVDNYEDGKLADHGGSWQAGIDGAKPGIIMKADPRIGDSYYQEYYKGKAEDRGDVISLSEKVSLTYGDFKDCLETKDYSRLEPALIEYKYYCPEVGFLTQEKENVDGNPHTIELVSVTHI